MAQKRRHVEEILNRAERTIGSGEQLLAQIDDLTRDLDDQSRGQILYQLLGVAIAWALAIVGTLVILKICDLVLGVRVSSEQENEGLDLSMHGEEAYNLEG